MQQATPGYKLLTDSSVHQIILTMQIDQRRENECGLKRKTANKNGQLWLIQMLSRLAPLQHNFNIIHHFKIRPLAGSI